MWSMKHVHDWCEVSSFDDKMIRYVCPEPGCDYTGRWLTAEELAVAELEDDIR